MASTDAWLGETPAAWMTPVTWPRAVAVFTQRVHRCTGGDVGSGSADVETGVRKYLGRSVGVLLAQVGQQDVLACADTPGDGLAYLAGSYDDDNFGHGDLPSSLSGRSRMVTAWAEGPVTWPTMAGP